MRTDHLDDGTNVPGHLFQGHDCRESNGNLNRIQQNELNVNVFLLLPLENVSKPCMCGRSAPRWDRFERTARLPLSIQRPHRQKPLGNLEIFSVFDCFS